MSQITAQILAKLAPSTNNSTRNRFLPYLNKTLPRYEITSENQVAAFLATCCFESAYFRATKEGHARVGTKARRYQDKYWGSNMMGRGLIQLTHLAGYQAFQDDVGDDAGIDVIANPALLEQPKWAVEASCWYWQANNLNRYADQGLRGYFALQGRVNRGDPTKEALEYPTRLRLFETALRVLPDGFVLDSSIPATTAANDGNPSLPQPSNTTDQPDPVSTDTANTASADTAPDLSGSVIVPVPTQSDDAQETETNVSVSTSQIPAPELVEIKPKTPTWKTTIGAGLTAIWGYYQLVKENFGELVDRATGGIDARILAEIFIGLALIGLAYWLYNQGQKRAHEQTLALIKAAADPLLNTVELK